MPLDPYRQVTYGSNMNPNGTQIQAPAPTHVGPTSMPQYGNPGGNASNHGIPTPTVGGTAVANTPSPVSDRMREFSIGLANGSITSQDQVNPTGSFGSQFNEAGQRTSGSASPVFQQNYGAPVAPRMTSASATPGSTSASQGDVSGAGSTVSGTSRYGFGGGTTPEEEELTRFIENPEKPKSASEIAADEIRMAQEQVNAINVGHDDQLREQGRVNDMRSAETNAMSVLSGLTGSSEASTRGIQTSERNAGDNRKIQNERAVALTTLYRQIQNERAVALTTLYRQIQSDAKTEARQQATDYRNNAKDALTSISARREKNAARTKSMVVAMGKEGATIEGLKSSYAPEEYKHIVDAFGSEAELKGALFAAHSDKAVGTPFIVGTKAYQYVQTPDGKTKLEEIDMPEGFVGEGKKPLMEKMGDDLVVSTDGGVTWKTAFTGKPDTLKQLQIQKAQQDLAKGAKEAKGSGSSYTAELATQGRTAVKGLLAIAEASPGIFGRTAAMPGFLAPDMLRTDAFRNYQGQLEYLKGNVIPAALSAMREASKTGGALGAVSDREGAWLASSLGALSMTQSPSEVVKQLKLVDEHLAAWQTAVEQHGGESQGAQSSQIIYQGKTYNVDANGDMTPA